MSREGRQLEPSAWSRAVVLDPESLAMQAEHITDWSNPNGPADGFQPWR
jgi:hypothetical protein